MKKCKLVIFLRSVVGFFSRKLYTIVEITDIIINNDRKYILYW